MKGVRYVSLAENSGYGLSGRAYMRALLQEGVPLEWVPLIQTTTGYLPWDRVEGSERWLRDTFDSDLSGAIGIDIDCDTNLLHTVPEYWPHHVERGMKNVGYTVWETDQLPPHWLELLDQTERVLVPCRFNLPVFRKSGFERPLEVVPHIVPPLEPVTEERADRFAETYGVPRDRFLFYATDVWNPRKAPWKTLQAYLQAFSGAEAVSFVFKTSAMGPRSSIDVENSPTDELVRQIVSNYSDPAHIVLIRDDLSHDDIESLHEIGHCYLSLTHGEGWGLGAFHAAARGNPVIITGWGGQLDYLTSDWPYLVDFEMTPVMHAQGRGSYQPWQQWASPSIDHSVQLMRSVFREPALARERGRQLAVRLHEDFDARKIGRQLLRVLES